MTTAVGLPPFDVAEYECHRVLVPTSCDTIRIPMTLIHKKSIQLDGRYLFFLASKLMDEDD